ncbi:MAG: hypothetical protein LYZ69_00085 [Nitrososphaerales archaeon]|nr:hypothetical protein [Nitrososphaerales archaeon]
MEKLKSSRATLLSLAVVLVVIIAAFGYYYMTTSGTVASQNSMLAAGSSSISAFNTQVSSLVGQTSTYQQTISSYSSQLSQLEARLASLQAQYNQSQSRIVSLQAITDLKSFEVIQQRQSVEIQSNSSTSNFVSWNFNTNQYAGYVVLNFTVAGTFSPGSISAVAFSTLPDKQGPPTSISAAGASTASGSLLLPVLPNMAYTIYLYNERAYAQTVTVTVAYYF